LAAIGIKVSAEEKARRKATDRRAFAAHECGPLPARLGCVVARKQVHKKKAG
jgi:hypothetical protein